jgi:GMP synthase-like glutamine amidotransferase
MTSCLVIQHVAPEGPYVIRGALERAGVTVDIRSVGDGVDLPPDLAGFEGLVVMGGPMSATGDEGFPTRRAELDLLADALHRGLPTLGVCLGCPAPGPGRRGGGVPRPGRSRDRLGAGRADREAADDPLLTGLPAELTVLHWHGDTFDPPPGAVLLAVSPRYRSQAFPRRSPGLGTAVPPRDRPAGRGRFRGAFGADALRAGTTPASIKADADAALSAPGAVARPGLPPLRRARRGPRPPTDGRPAVVPALPPPDLPFTGMFRLR